MTTSSPSQAGTLRDAAARFVARFSGKTQPPQQKAAPIRIATVATPTVRTPNPIEVALAVAESKVDDAQAAHERAGRDIAHALHQLAASPTTKTMLERMWNEHGTPDGIRLAVHPVYGSQLRLKQISGYLELEVDFGSHIYGSSAWAIDREASKAGLEERRAFGSHDGSSRELHFLATPTGDVANYFAANRDMFTRVGNHFPGISARSIENAVADWASKLQLDSHRK